MIQDGPRGDGAASTVMQARSWPGPTTQRAIETRRKRRRPPGHTSGSRPLGHVAVAGSVTLAGLVLLSGLGPVALRLPVSPFETSKPAALSLKDQLGEYSMQNVSLGRPGASPDAAAYDPVTEELYVAMAPSYVDVVSTVTDTVVATIDIGLTSPTGSEAMVYDAADGYILVLSGEGPIVAINPLSQTVAAQIPLPGDEQSLLYVSGADRVFVAGYAGLAVLNGTTLAKIDELSIDWSTALAFDPATDEVADTWFEQLEDDYWFVTSIYVTNLSVAWQAAEPSLTGVFGPYAAAYDPADGDLYLPGAPTGTNVTVVSAASGALVATVPVGIDPAGLTYDAPTRTVLVANAGSGNVSSINGTKPERASIPVGGSPLAVVEANGTDRVWVTNFDSDTLTGLNDTSVGTLGANATTVWLGGAPDAVAIDPDTGTIYAGGGSSLFGVNETTLVTSGPEPVGPLASAVVYDPGTRSVYVANTDSDTVTVVSGTTMQVTATINVCAGPDGLAYDSATEDILVACGGTDLMDVITDSSNSVAREVEVGPLPEGVVYDPLTNGIFVETLDGLSEVSPTTWTVTNNNTVYASGPPVFPALDLATDDIYVPVWYLGVVDVVSASNDSLVGTVAVGGTPVAAAVDPTTGLVYVSNSEESSVDYVSVISGQSRTLLGNLTIPGDPVGMAYDSEVGALVVADEDSDNLTLVTPVTSSPPPPPPTCGFPNPACWFSVEITEEGLPIATAWSVQLYRDGVPLLSVSAAAPSPISLTADNGSYNVTVGTVPGYQPTPSGIEFSIHGASLPPWAVKFSPLSPVLPIVSPSSTWTWPSVVLVGGGIGVCLFGLAVLTRARRLER